jgi:hypothetical protein
MVNQPTYQYICRYSGGVCIKPSLKALRAATDGMEGRKFACLHPDGKIQGINAGGGHREIDDEEKGSIWVILFRAKLVKA